MTKTERRHAAQFDAAVEALRGHGWTVEVTEDETGRSFQARGDDAWYARFMVITFGTRAFHSGVTNRTRHYASGNLYGAKTTAGPKIDRRIRGFADLFHTIHIYSHYGRPEERREETA